MKFSQVWTRRSKSDDRHRWSASFWSFSPRLSVVMLSLTVLVGSASQLSAQSITSGDIVGVVADPSGAVLPNIEVTLKSDAKGNTQVQSTNSHGVYRFSLLAPGSYTVSVICSRVPGSNDERRGNDRAGYHSQHSSISR